MGMKGTCTIMVTENFTNMIVLANSLVDVVISAQQRIRLSRLGIGKPVLVSLSPLASQKYVLTLLRNQRSPNLLTYSVRNTDGDSCLSVPCFY